MASVPSEVRPPNAMVNWISYLHWLALQYLQAGMSVIPIVPDGTKGPLIELLPRISSDGGSSFHASWKPYQERFPTNEELYRWFAPGRGTPDPGIAVIGGAVSGGLEILDIDNFELATPWFQTVQQRAPELAGKLVFVQTPRPGLHVYYRCTTISGNQKLASRLVPNSDADGVREQVAIETRGEGGYVLAPGSPPACHSTGRYYSFATNRDYSQIPLITESERAVLLDAAMALNEVPVEVPISRRPAERDLRNVQSRPGDDFNERGDWSEILTPHGWSHAGTGANGEERWRRPGKDSSVSATVNYANRQLLHVFTQNGAPFQAGRSYKKFHAFALLNCRGDYSAAARELAKRGYGKPLSRSSPRPPSRRQR
jgi:hypothetical protein